MNTKHVLANWNNSRLETIDLVPEYFDRAGEISDQIIDETQQWETYLHILAMLSFEKWLQGGENRHSHPVTSRRKSALFTGKFMFDNASNNGRNGTRSSIARSRYLCTIKVL